ncbi:MAG: thiamine phosphate synthase [Cytophagales bacterium]|nr:thiamine phosphate synthase [Cytophagales bacterium]
MKISRLQYITQENKQSGHLDCVENACEAGCDWVQLRVKNRPDEQYLKIARTALALCKKAGSKLIINDNVSVAKEIRADGVHLGKDDMPPGEARKILGSDFIIGATANTFEDLEKSVDAGVDYIGLGPFRYTNTKERLSPILGLEGFHKIIHQTQMAGIDIPVIAIGGILTENIEPIMQTGIYGIAVSGLITHATDPKKTVSFIKEKLRNATLTSSRQNL